LRLLPACLVAVLVLSSCSGSKTIGQDSDGPKDESEAIKARVHRGVKPEPDAEVAVIETGSFGNIVIELYPNIAPSMVNRFKQLIKEGFYNGTTFHRVDPRLGIIQGGDPLSKDSNPLNDGMGDSSYPNVPAELSDLPYERGTVGAARKGAAGGLTELQALDTANCQFYITLKRQSAFDEKYTVFGRVLEGINNADIIAGAPVENRSDRPSDRIVVKSITLQPRAQFVNGK